MIKSQENGSEGKQWRCHHWNFTAKAVSLFNKLTSQQYKWYIFLVGEWLENTKRAAHLKDFKDEIKSYFVRQTCWKKNYF